MGQTIPQLLQSRELERRRQAVELFEWRFGHPPPDEPHHVGTFLAGTADAADLVCYIHFRPRSEILLGGGACVDTRMMRQLSSPTRRAIRDQGGLYQLTLRWALGYFAPNYKAVFGYCGDALAERADRAAGFVDTGHKHLLVYWLRDCDAATRSRLIAEAHAAGPF